MPGPPRTASSIDNLRACVATYSELVGCVSCGKKVKGVRSEEWHFHHWRGCHSHDCNTPGQIFGRFPAGGPGGRLN